MVIACTRDCYDTCIFDETYTPLKIFPTLGFTCSRGLTDLRRNEINRVTRAYVEGKEKSIAERDKVRCREIKGYRSEESSTRGV